MNILVENILLIAVVGFALAVISNIVLLWGRKEGVSFKDVLTSGHLNRKAREKFFNPTPIRIASWFGYVGVGLFMIAILLIVVMTIWRPNG